MKPTQHVIDMVQRVSAALITRLTIDHQCKFQDEISVFVGDDIFTVTGLGFAHYQPAYTLPDNLPWSDVNPFHQLQMLELVAEVNGINLEFYARFEIEL